MVQDHDVFVAKARYFREKSSLICIHEGFDLVFRDENVALFMVGNIGWFVFGRFEKFSLSGPLGVGRACAPFEFPRIWGSTLQRFLHR